jgi:hypothetical protein
VDFLDLRGHLIGVDYRGAVGRDREACGIMYCRASRSCRQVDDCHSVGLDGEPEDRMLGRVAALIARQEGFAQVALDSPEEVQNWSSRSWPRISPRSRSKSSSSTARKP